MQGCLIVILLIALSPRVLGLVFLCFTNWWGKAYDSVIWPVLGWIFMPWTSLTYMGAMLNNNNTVSGWWTVLMVLAVVVDIGNALGAGNQANEKN